MATNTNVPAVRPMTRKEAQKLTDDIRATGAKLGELLIESQQREAWRALGYDSWRAYASEEFGLSESHAYRLVGAAEVSAVLAAAGTEVDSLPESHARELRPLVDDPDRMVDAYQDASSDGTPTAAKVRDAVAEQVADTLPATKKPKKPHDPADDFAGTPPDDEPMPAVSNAADTIVVFTRIADDLVTAIETESWPRVNDMVRPAVRRIADALNTRVATEKKKAAGTGGKQASPSSSKKTGGRDVTPRLKKT